jgi:hypothetical protein
MRLGVVMADLTASWPYLRPYGAFREGCERLPLEIERQLIGSCTTDAEALYAGRLIDQPTSRPSKASQSSQILRSGFDPNGPVTPTPKLNLGIPTDHRVGEIAGNPPEKGWTPEIASAAVTDSVGIPGAGAGGGRSVTYIGPGLWGNCYSDLCQGKSDIRYGDFVGLFLVTPTRHGRACPGHPRLAFLQRERRGCPQQVRA